MRSFKRIAVYCGSSGAVDPVFIETARSVGAFLATKGITVVYGGGKVGTMGAVANGALAAGGSVIGVITEKLQDLEVGHTGLTELHIVNTMSERKGMMMDLADAYIALPGGFGTLEEFAETISLAVLNYHDKPTGLLNLDGFYDSFFEFLDHAEAVGFIRPGQARAMVSSPQIADLYKQLMACEITSVSEWL